MTTRFATPEETATWDDHIIHNPDGGNVFQSYEIATVKQQSGWKARFLFIDDLALTIHERYVPGIGKLWYLPKGPGVVSVKAIATLLPPLRAFAKRHGVFAVKIEPELLDDEEIRRRLTDLGLIPVGAIQPNASTVIIDTTPPLEEIMASLNQKGRHAIRRAERDGVTARAVPFSEETCQTMYHLMRQTAEGQWRTRSYAYYKAFWKSFADLGVGQFFFAYYEGEVVASAYAMFFGAKGTYKDGASVRKRTAYGASHLLQWEVIKWMKSHDVTSYDLCGVPPSHKILDESHPHYGLGRFKTSFNKQVTDYIGAYDLVIKPVSYKVWTRVGERAVIRLHSARFGEYWY
jgi:lipid II:glycine glycyltransferase (peptidoglycan interpeptide bridge formation enzyme)